MAKVLDKSVCIVASPFTVTIKGILKAINITFSLD